MDPFLVSVLTHAGVLGFIALSAYVVLQAGVFSLGQQAFFAIGAYAAGIATALWGWTLAPGLALGALGGAAAAFLVGLPTLRLKGLHFAVATFAFAEATRLVFEMARYRVLIDGMPVGPDGSDGFRGIRYIFENDIGPVQFLALIWGLLGIILVGLLRFERSPVGIALRMTGLDAGLAAQQGVGVAACRLGAVTLGGALAGLGGGLYAHMATYVEPAMFGPMMGIHALAYGLIGGLGTPFGPLFGVLFDVGLLESTRLFHGYRMIVFGGLVALLLIVRPRGVLDEAAVRWLGHQWRKAGAMFR